MVVDLSGVARHGLGEGRGATPGVTRLEGSIY